MRNLLALVAGAVFVASVSAPMAAADLTVKGEVVDVQCSMKKGAAGKGHDHAACAMGCAKSGQPVGLLTADAIYTLTGDYAANNNAKLLDFIAKPVEITGEVTEKDGQKLMNVKSIKLVK